MTLQVDPNDPEREQFIRMKIENRHSNKLKKAFREFNTRIVESFPEDFNPDFDSFDLRRNARLLRAEEDELYDILNRMLQESADLGVNVAIDQFETVGFYKADTSSGKSLERFSKSDLFHLNFE